MSDAKAQSQNRSSELTPSDFVDNNTNMTNDAQTIDTSEEVFADFGDFFVWHCERVESFEYPAVSAITAKGHAVVLFAGGTAAGRGGYAHIVVGRYDCSRASHSLSAAL